MSAYGERIAAMEVEVKELKAELREHKDQTTESFKEINQKLDTLLSIRNKGAGIVWFLGGLTGLASLIYNFLHWK